MFIWGFADLHTEISKWIFIRNVFFFFSCLIIFSVPFERILRLRKKELLNGF